MLEALKALKSLGPDQRRLLEEKRLEGQYEPGALVELLRPVAAFDRVSDKGRTAMGCTTALLFVLGFVGLVVAGNVGAFLLPLPIALFGGAVWLLVSVLKLKKLDLSNNFRQVAMPLFAVLREDMEPGAAINVRLDLSRPTAKEKKTGEGAPYEKGVYFKVVDTTYRDSWFGGGARLADGSLLQWDVTDDIVERKGTKRGTRGKIKTKTKYVKRSSIWVSVSLPQKRYALAQETTESGEKVKVREGERRMTFRTARHVKTKSIDPIDPRELFAAFSEAFNRVRPVAESGSAS